MLRFYKEIIYLFLCIGLVLSISVSSFYLSENSQGDLNLDGKIDILDLNLLQSAMLSENFTTFLGDQNGDGKVNVIDLQILFNCVEKKWQEKGTRCPACIALIDKIKDPSLHCKNLFIKHDISFLKITEYNIQTPSFRPEDKGFLPKQKFYYLTGFFCHAPPTC